MLAWLDAYPKTLPEFKRRTTSGAVITLATATLVLLLSAVEVADFARLKTVESLSVDTSRDKKLRVNVNITFPALPCAILTVDALDLSSNHVRYVSRALKKYRLDKKGKLIPALGTPSRKLLSAHNDGHPMDGIREKLGDSSNMMLSKILREIMQGNSQHQQMLKKHQDELRTHLGEGCHVEGHVVLKRVAGSIHFLLDEEDISTLMAVFQDSDQLNVSHIIHSISFGEPYPGMFNPLDDSIKKLDHGSFVQYFIKVVPTLFESISGAVIDTNQYTYTELVRASEQVRKVPAVHFNYEISPIMAIFSEQRKSLGSFLTQLCAIVGGVIAAAGMLDSFVFRLSTRVWAPGLADKK